MQGSNFVGLHLGALLDKGINFLSLPGLVLTKEESLEGMDYVGRTKFTSNPNLEEPDFVLDLVLNGRRDVWGFSGNQYSKNFKLAPDNTWAEEWDAEMDFTDIPDFSENSLSGFLETKDFHTPLTQSKSTMVGEIMSSTQNSSQENLPKKPEEVSVPQVEQILQPAAPLRKSRKRSKKPKTLSQNSEISAGLVKEQAQKDGPSSSKQVESSTSGLLISEITALKSTIESLSTVILELRSPVDSIQKGTSTSRL